MTDETFQPVLITRVIYDDDDLIELKSSLTSAGWNGVAQTYASASDLGMQAAELLRWTRLCEGESVVQAGSDTSDPNGLLMLRFRTIDMAGHTVCSVTLVNGSWLGGYPSAMPRSISLEFRTEPALIERFARQLATIGVTRAGEARLDGVL